MNRLKSFIRNLFVDKKYEDYLDGTTQIFYSKNRIGRNLLPIAILGIASAALASFGIYNYIKKKQEEEYQKFLNSDYDNDG
ncbi:MAG: hypothetical protein QXW01_03470, partial [Candidatus Aenigmatarchaeota archaeon]